MRTGVIFGDSNPMQENVKSASGEHFVRDRKENILGGGHGRAPLKGSDPKRQKVGAVCRGCDELDGKENISDDGQ